nr:hypothetical protein GCM10020092_028010 [Actinoplanes digitatis]
MDGWDRPPRAGYRDAVSTNEEPWQARYLLTAGPWRALAYVITTCPFAALTGMAVGTLILPWLVAVLRLHDGRMLEGPLLFLMVTALALFAGLGPLVAIPLAAVERGRLALVDRRPVRSGHRAAEPNPVSWLRLRYTEAATWREVLYAVILGLVVPVVYGVYALLALIDVACVVSPLFAATGTDSWQFGVFTVNSTAEAIPLSIFGLLFVPVLAHLLGLISARPGGDGPGPARRPGRRRPAGGGAVAGPAGRRVRGRAPPHRTGPARRRTAPADQPYAADRHGTPRRAGRLAGGGTAGAGPRRGEGADGGAAGPDSRHPAAVAGRPGAARRAARARRPVAAAGDGHGRGRDDPPRAARRGLRLLRGVRGAGQRGPAQRGEPRRPAARADRRRCWCWRSATTATAAPTRRAAPA